MADPQRHVHYTKTTFGQKLFYVGLGALIYWLSASGGCQKAKSYLNEKIRRPAIERSQSGLEQKLDYVAIETTTYH